MSKPDGITQDAWDATDKIRNEPFHWKGPEECAFLVAKAIMAAKAEEREACAVVAESYKHKENGFKCAEPDKSVYGWGAARRSIANSIRSRT